MSEDTEETPQEDTRDAEQRKQANATKNLSAGPDRTVAIDSSAVSLLATQSSSKKALSEQEATRKKQLQEVQIKPEDVLLIMNEFEIPKSAAELTLRENGGNIRAALEALVR